MRRAAYTDGIKRIRKNCFEKSDLEGRKTMERGFETGGREYCIVWCLEVSGKTLHVIVIMRLFLFCLLCRKAKMICKTDIDYS